MKSGAMLSVLSLLLTEMVVSAQARVSQPSQPSSKVRYESNGSASRPVFHGLKIGVPIGEQLPKCVERHISNYSFL